MPLRAIVLTLACVALLAAGQLLFKLSAMQWRVEGFSLATLRSFLSPTMIVALAIYAFATVLWVYVLREAPLSIAYPLFALAFIVTPLLAHRVLGEPFDWRSVAGGALIVAGVWISTLR